MGCSRSLIAYPPRPTAAVQGLLALAVLFLGLAPSSLLGVVQKGGAASLAGGGALAVACA